MAADRYNDYGNKFQQWLQSCKSMERKKNGTIRKNIEGKKKDIRGVMEGWWMVYYNLSQMVAQLRW